MHAAFVIALSTALTLAACSFPQELATIAPAILALLVGCIGLPHGAADHLYARSLFGRSLGVAGMTVFLLTYLAVAALVVVSWQLSPGITIVSFFLLSAWHFGQEEPVSAGRLTASVEGSGCGILRSARGGLVIWGVILFQREAAAEILKTICHAGASPAIGFAFTLLTPIAIVGLSLCGLLVLLQSVDAARAGAAVRRTLLSEILLSVSFLLLAAVASPLVSFAVYFCVWHSALGLKRLRRELRVTWPRLVAILSPLTLGAIVLCVIGAAYVWRIPEFSQVLTRTTFLGLSAVAVPHILLHGAGPIVVGRLGRPRKTASSAEVFA